MGFWVVEVGFGTICGGFWAIGWSPPADLLLGGEFEVRLLGFCCEFVMVFVGFIMADGGSGGGSLPLVSVFWLGLGSEHV